MINQLILNGIIVGSVYTLVAVGFVVIYRTVRFFHFAHGVVFTAGAYFTFLFKAWLGWPVIAAGSLLEVFSKREGLSFPVGRVKDLFMYPVTFMEYLEAQNPLLAEKLLQPDVLEESSPHDLLLDAFNAYAFVGSIPATVTSVLDTEKRGCRNGFSLFL